MMNNNRPPHDGRRLPHPLPGVGGPNRKTLRDDNENLPMSKMRPSPMNNPNPHGPLNPAGGGAPQPFKVNLCRHFAMRGSCPYGNRCTYKHGLTDSARTVLNVAPRPYRVVPCRHWYASKTCPHGNECSFLHDDPEAPTTQQESTVTRLLTYCCPTMLSTGVCNTPGCQYAHYATLPSTPSMPLNPSKYKTQICQNWTTSGGNCLYGTRCLFAHGDNELRSH